MSNTITLTLTGIAHGGEAFGRYGEKVVFVPYTIPGETVRVELAEEKKRWARAHLVQVLEASPDRVDPPCPYFGPGQCGGCQWQHIAYERQLRLKAEVVVDQLRRLGHIADPPVLDPIALADDQGLLAFGYRNHVQLVAIEEGRLGFVRDRPGRRQGVGDKGQGSRDKRGDVIAVDRCLLLHPLLDEMHRALVAGAQEPIVGIAAELGEEEVTQPWMTASTWEHLRRVILRAGVNTGQQLLVLETKRGRPPGLAVADLPLRCALRRQDGSTQPLIGEPWLEEMVAGRVFRVSAGSFFQVNTVGAETLVYLAAEMLAPEGHETLLDGYCGVGLFGLSLAEQVGQVIGIEEAESACDDFAWNAGDLDNVALFEGPVAEVLAAMDAAQRLDLAVIDPPRSGAGPKVISHLARLGVRRLLYVSCDPATLARDARLLLEAGYQLQQVQPIDMFPQTYHVESMALFARTAAVQVLSS